MFCQALISVTTSKRHELVVYNRNYRGLRDAGLRHERKALRGRRVSTGVEKARAIRGGRGTRARKEALEKAEARSWAERQIVAGPHSVARRRLLQGCACFPRRSSSRSGSVPRRANVNGGAIRGCAQTCHACTDNADDGGSPQDAITHKSKSGSDARSHALG